VKDERDMSTDELRRVMISRKVGLMVGSSCQHVFISSTNSDVSSLASWAGIVGRRPSRITATATAAGLSIYSHSYIRSFIWSFIQGVARDDSEGVRTSSRDRVAGE
jgi:hypothetical protein